LLVLGQEEEDDDDDAADGCADRVDVGKDEGM
jgi:hypothetical protein